MFGAAMSSGGSLLCESSGDLPDPNTPLQRLLLGAGGRHQISQGPGHWACAPLSRPQPGRRRDGDRVSRGPSQPESSLMASAAKGRSRPRARSLRRSHVPRKRGRQRRGKGRRQGWEVHCRGSSRRARQHHAGARGPACARLGLASYAHREDLVAAMLTGKKRVAE
jgi:hypothetical protein